MKATISLMRSGVARRILGLFMICALLPIGSLAVLSLHEMSGKLRDQTEQRLRHASRTIGISILEGLIFLRTEMEAVAVTRTGITGSLPAMADPTTMGMQQRFLGMTLYRGQTGGDDLFGIPCPLPPLTEASRRHLASGESILRIQGIDGGPPRIYMAVAVDRRSPERAVLVGEIHPNYLRHIVENSLPVEGGVAVLGPNGAFLYRSAQFPAEFSARVVDPLRQLFSGQIEWEQDGNAFLVNYRSIFLEASHLSGNWVVLVTQPKAEAFAPVESFSRAFVLVLALAFSVVLLMSIVQIRKSLVPLAKLKDGTQKISQGEFESRIEIKSGDEFEDLARSFNSMSDRLGREFHALTGTSQIVRSVLTGREKETIIRTVLSDFRSVVPCEEVGLSLLDDSGNGAARTYFNGSGPVDPKGSGGHRSFFTADEMRRLERTENDLLVESVGEFPGVLPLLSEKGCHSFALYPIRQNENLAGVLAAGYGKEAKPGREDRLRSRQIADQIAVALANAALLEELAGLNRGAMTALARAVDANSPWTGGHSERVTELSLRIGREMGLAQTELDLLERGGLLHDIGKISIPGRILDKPAALTPEEREIVNRHPERGSDILLPIPAFREVIPIVMQHHERFDGSGYPYGLSGEAITLGARILAVADVYDALVSDRPYRPGWTREKVLSHIDQNSGRRFDPAVVRVVLELFREKVPVHTIRDGRQAEAAGRGTGRV